MIGTDDFDRVLQQWLEGDAPGPEPRVLLATVIDTTRRRRPRPGWLVRARGGGIAARPVRVPLTRSRLRPLRLALLLGPLVALAVAVAALVGSQPSPGPAGISNGWIAFAANPNGPEVDYAELKDIYLTGGGVAARRIIGVDGDGLSQDCPRFSPEGSRLAYGEGEESSVPAYRGRLPVTGRAVRVVELDANGEPSLPTVTIALPTGPGPFPCPEWSPTGTRVAFFTGPEIWVVDLASRETTRFPATPTEAGLWAFKVVWSPDGTLVVLAHEGQFRVIPVDGGMPRSFRGTWAGWTDGGRRIVYATDTAVRVADLDGGNDRPLTVSAEDVYVDSVLVSPDGNRVVYSRTLNHCIDAFNAAGEWEGSECQQEDLPLIVMAADGTDGIELTTPLSPVGLWSPDSLRLLYEGDDPDVRAPASPVLIAVAVTPGPVDVIYPFLDVSGVGMDISWQAVPR